MANFDELLLRYKEEFLNDLNELLRIRSVSAEGDEVPKQALHWMLAKAESFGLKTKNISDIAGHAEYGDGETLCGVLTHLDVVPANSADWSCEPFALTEKNGRLYGRGVADDKGAALAALYCLRILKESGIVGNKIRVIFGTSEEIGMKDMEKYFSCEPLPDLSFTPDSEYGICRAEKGILHLKLSSKNTENPLSMHFEAGSANNVVPDTAVVTIAGGETEMSKLQKSADAYAPGTFDISYIIDGVRVTAHGKAAHACEPEKGVNAAAALAGLICEAFGNEAAGGLCSFIDKYIGNETNGSLMGIKMRDDVSGELTLTLSRVNINEKEASAVLDIRYPVTFREEDVLAPINECAENVSVIDGEKPLMLDDNAPIVRVLGEAYENVMGEAVQLFTTGGGTYARMLGGKGVAFGPVFPDDDSRIHNSDESIDEEKFFRHFRICLEAMNGMMLYK